jgi:hypothetical protein
VALSVSPERVRRAALLTWAVLVLAGAAAAAREPPSATAAPGRRCPAPTDPASTLKVVARPGVRVQGVDCATGRRVGRAYVAECRDELLYEAACGLVVSRRSWRCDMRVTGGYGDYSHISCAAGAGRRVRFDVVFRYP